MSRVGRDQSAFLDAERKAFLQAFNAYVESPDICADVKRQEAEATIQAVRQLCQLAGISDV